MSKSFIRHFFDLSLIGLVFCLSCGREGTQQEGAVEWYTELGFKKVGEQMKKDTQLLTRKINEGEWNEAIKLCATIGKSFEKLDLNNPVIPKEFSEFKQSFDSSLSKLLLACQDKDSEKVKIRLQVFKKSCHHCHVVFRKEMKRSQKETDYGVALERLYTD